jgi:hypothetical protein
MDTTATTSVAPVSFSRARKQIMETGTRYGWLVGLETATTYTFQDATHTTTITHQGAQITTQRKPIER